MDGYHKSKAKRVRTTFTEEQLQVLQANFQIDSNPDGQDLERIASVTGLSKRVTQVWFQNSRGIFFYLYKYLKLIFEFCGFINSLLNFFFFMSARQKKHIHAGKNKSNSFIVFVSYSHVIN